jgi:chitin disaccharide deacetylase
MNRENMGSRCIVFAADDMGRTDSVNEAILDAYDNGILTAASIMPGGDAFLPAAAAVRERTGISVGLHVTLCDGKAVLPHTSLPELTGSDGKFLESAAAVWRKLGKDNMLAQAAAEIEAQFDRLKSAGIQLDYVDSHHHLHMHPGLFATVCRIAAERGVAWIRIPNEPLSVVARFRARSRGLMPFAEWAVFGLLRKSNLSIAKKYNLHSTDSVYGLSGTGEMDESRVIGLLECMSVSAGTFINELFLHPDTSTAGGLMELDALKSQKVIAKLDSLGIKRIQYKINTI